jgi:hypothetical protein
VCIQHRRKAPPRVEVPRLSDAAGWRYFCLGDHSKTSGAEENAASLGSSWRLAHAKDASGHAPRVELLLQFNQVWRASVVAVHVFLAHSISTEGDHGADAQAFGGLDRHRHALEGVDETLPAPVIRCVDICASSAAR